MTRVLGFWFRTALGYGSGLFLLPGWVYGLLYYRFRDGMHVAKRQLERLDNNCIDNGIAGVPPQKRSI